jgi:crotonobetainyl-CoA:carnitine CoA-transferase CaiB-like acyl-CoA transferase
LGALGAEIIKVEWPINPSTRGALTGGRAPDGFPVNLNTDGHFSDNNANKLSITLNTRTPMGNDLVKRLVSISDIVIENFAAGVLDRWGLSYEEMKKLNPDIVYLSMSGFGHTGRNKDYQTMGPIAQALSGLTYTSGLPDHPPAGWGWSYMDDTGGMYGAMYALSGLYHRNITGEGQHIDSSQWIKGVQLNGAAFLDIQANNRPSAREGYPPGNRAVWPGAPVLDNYREGIYVPHNAYRTSPGEYNDWCAIVCFTDEEWKKLVGVMGSPSWATDSKLDTLQGRLDNQEEIDNGIETWTKTLGKYEIMELCQAAGVPSMPVQSNEDSVENDPQLKAREVYQDMEHATLGVWPLQNAPFKMSETPAYNDPGPASLIGQHNKEIFEGLLGISHEELVNGYEDGTFWPKDHDRSLYPYMQDMIDDASKAVWDGNQQGPSTPPEPTRTVGSNPGGPFSGMRVLELADKKGQWSGKLMGDLGADVIKIEPPEGESARNIGPFYQDIPDKEKSLYFWHYNTSKRSITLNLETEDGKQIFKRLADSADVIIETFKPGYMKSIGLDYEELKSTNPGLIMCSITPFGQTGPWKDYLTGDLLHLAAGGQMAACGYTDTDLPDAPPIAGGGGQSWHMGSHYANIAISAALMYKSVTGIGQYIDVSIHESCSLTREMHVNTWIYQKKVPMRQTGRHASAAPNQQSQHVCADGKYLNVAAQILTALTPERLHILGEWMKEEGLSEDLIEEKYRNPDSITDNELFLYFIANMSRDDVFHGGQKRGFNMGAIRNLDEVMQDPHLDDRDYWAEVDYPELGIKLKHPGPGGIFKGSPWQISRRAPFLGEHNKEILSGELGISDDEIGNLGKSGTI